MSVVAIEIAIAIATFGAVNAQAEIAFTEVTDSAGLAYTGDSWGAAWADFNLDGLADLWVTNHADAPSLYINQGDGSFIDVAATTVVADITADMHGAVWADFDNDGDQDLLQTVGAMAGTGSGPNIMLHNAGGLLTDMALELGLDYPMGRGRTPLWFDWDGDGHLDVLLANQDRPDGQWPTALLSQRGAVFIDDSIAAGVNAPGLSLFAQTTGVAGYDTPLLLIHGESAPQRAYKYNSLPFLNVSGSGGILPVTDRVVQDAAIADFNGDLQADILMSRHKDASDLLLTSATTFRARFGVSGQERGMEMRTDGDLTVEVAPKFWIPLEEIFIGAAGSHPGNHEFFLDADDPATEGWAKHVPGVDAGLYIGRDPVEPVWRFYLSGPELVVLEFAGESTATLSDLLAINFAPNDGAQTDVLMAKASGGYIDSSVTAGLTTKTACRSLAAADFDNDMDMDAYLVCRGIVNNLPNVLLENNGSGVFTAVAAAGGAEGSTQGRGDNVVTADYDGDGFVDLFVTNGSDIGLFNIGPNQLFRNVGNGNHWLQIDLEGVLANRDGLGARVFAITGSKIQMRERSGGAHRYAQNLARLHFGLKDNTKVDALMVQWPNGAAQFVSNIPADQVIRIVQTSRPSTVGQAAIQPGVDRGVYVWQNTANGPHTLVVSSDAKSSVYAVRIVSAAPIQLLGNNGLEGADTLTSTPTMISLTSHVHNDGDAISFQLYAGAPTMISVERDGIRDPRDLHLGPQRLPVSPDGWIVDVADLPLPPSFQSGAELGLFVGAESDTVKARWNADSMTHDAFLLMISSQALGALTPVDIEVDDSVNAGTYHVLAQGKMGPGFDGFDIPVAPGSVVALSYKQDRLFQYHHVNPVTQELGLANAYRLK